MRTKRQLGMCMALLCFLAGGSVTCGQPVRRQYSGQPLQFRVVPQRANAQSGVSLNLAGNTVKTQFDAEVEDHFSKQNLPGLVVLMARDGLLTYQKTLGHADVAGNVKLTRNHVFRLASVSKWVAGVIALRTEQEGQINLNAKVKDCLPGLPEHHHQSRVIDTLTCRAGIRHYGGTQSPLSPSGWGNDEFEDALTPTQNIWHDPLKVPVSAYSYSTHSYCFLAACLEQATGESCKQLVRNKLSLPYGLGSLRVEDLDQTVPMRVRYYRPSSPQNPAAGNTVIAAPERTEWKAWGGGMECSAYDLLRLGMKVCDHQIISAGQLNRMTTRIEPSVSYTLGANTAIENGNRVIAKSGGQEGVSTYLWMVPEKRMVMVVLTNRWEGGGATGLGKKLRGIAFGSPAASARPDLVVESFARNGNIQHTGGKWLIPVRYRIRNSGTAGTSTTIFNGIKRGTAWRHMKSMATLPPSAAQTVETTIQVSDASRVMAGRTVDLVAHADAPIAGGDTSISPSGRVTESSEANNTRSLRIRLPGGTGGLTTGGQATGGQATGRPSSGSRLIDRRTKTSQP